MFSKDGNWKEFGIGRSKERYTWMPFWLFAILWAILSYTIVLVIVSNSGSNAISNQGNEVNEVNEVNEEDIIDIYDIDDVPPAISIIPIPPLPLIPVPDLIPI